MLVIRPNRWVRRVAWVFCALGAPVVLVGALAAVTAPAGWLLVLWGVVVFLPGAWLLGPRFRFDRPRGELAIRHMGRARRRALGDFRAVTVADAGRFFASSEDGESFTSHAACLAFRDPRARPLLLAYERDREALVVKARRVADHIGVPLEIRAPASDHDD